MLIIFGLRVFFRTIVQGVFHCPRCGGDRQYRLRTGRRFFTLFFVPIIPLARVGEHVQCMACQARFHTDVLMLPTAAQMSAALPEGMRAAALIMLRAGTPGQFGRTPAGDRGDSRRGRGWLRARGSRCRYRPAAGPDPGPLAQVGAQLTPEAREWFFAQAVRIAVVDGTLSAAQRRAAQAIGQHLAMTPAQTLGVITMTEQAAPHD